jgi:hypothetical protein
MSPSALALASAIGITIIISEALPKNVLFFAPYVLFVACQVKSA